MGRTGITGLRFYIMWLNSDSTLYSAKAQTSGESEFLFVYLHNKAFRRCIGKLCIFAFKEGDLSTDGDPDFPDYLYNHTPKRWEI